ncbi:MAG: tetratricopeptide repeat protein [Deltaproteobacteria bacterium]|nr:tetratricopeptide repeat protein [Deltaproteobacteria bacterium]
MKLTAEGMIKKTGSMCLIVATCLFFGCAAKTATPPVSDGTLLAREIVKEESSRNSSRIMASHSLTKEGGRLIKKGNIDGAISILERAIGINSKDGEGYYYLAEAWIKKGNLKLAAQYNKLACIYLRNDSRWRSFAEEQVRRISSAAGKGIKN